jgi:hypothetical protein
MPDTDDGIPDNMIISAWGKAFQELFPNDILVMKGATATPLKDADDWAQFQLLNSFELPLSTTQNSYRRVLLQLSCYSKIQQYRADAKFDAPWTLARKYKCLMHRKNIRIENTCLKIQDSKMIYMDLKASGDYAKEIYQSSPSLQIHSVVITSTALIG